MMITIVVSIVTFTIGFDTARGNESASARTAPSGECE